MLLWLYEMKFLPLGDEGNHKFRPDEKHNTLDK